MSEAQFSEHEIAWPRQRFAMMADGGVWAVPRSGLVFTRKGAQLELTGRMPWTDELAEAVAEGRDVPPDEAALRAYQDDDYRTIRSRFEAAGIPVTDGTRDGASADGPPSGGASGPYVSAGEASVFPPIDKDHPLAQAARETNDKAMAEGLEATLAWLGIGDPGELAYLAEQRALRAIAATTGIVMGEDAERDEVIARTIVETPLWKDMRLLLVGCYLDGFAIGWRAQQINSSRRMVEILERADAGRGEFDEAVARVRALLADDTPDHFEGNLGANIAGGRAGKDAPDA